MNGYHFNVSRKQLQTVLATAIATLPIMQCYCQLQDCQFCKLVNCIHAFTPCLVQVVKHMLPERHGEETHYVWAIVRTLDKPLTQSGLNRWPITWSVDPRDKAYFRSDPVNRDQRLELPTSNDQMVCKDVLMRLRTMVEWIMALPRTG